MTLVGKLALNLTRGQSGVFLFLKLFQCHLLQKSDGSVRSTMRNHSVRFILLISLLHIAGVLHILDPVRLRLSASILALIVINNLLLLINGPGAPFCIWCVAERCRAVRRCVRLLITRACLNYMLIVWVGPRSYTNRHISNRSCLTSFLFVSQRLLENFVR